MEGRMEEGIYTKGNIGMAISYQDLISIKEAGKMGTNMVLESTFTTVKIIHI